MDVLKEKQYTLRATKRPVEYNYTNADIHHTDTNPSDGYQFEYPVNWTADQSTNKVIGIRRINYKPTSLDIAFKITIPSDDNEIPVRFVFTDQNTFEECINAMVVEINNKINDKGSTYVCATSYDKALGTFSLAFDEGGASHTYEEFKIEFVYGNDSLYDPSDPSKQTNEYKHYKSNFLMLFNQPITQANIDIAHNLSQLTTELKFDNVWNRDSFYCHASFSDSPRQIIGINHDFWPTPSVFYAPGDNSNDFNVYFTTNTVNRILPRNGVMLIQLSYIFNYQTSMLSYT